MGKEHPAVENLRAHQRQLDMDGSMVAVSRQALVETLALYDALLRHSAEVMDHLENSGPRGVPYLMDNDDNPGEHLRRAIRTARGVA